MSRLVLVLGDQLSLDIAALTEANKSGDIIVMAEVMGEASYVPHHPQKIALVLAAMRKFAARLEAAGWNVAYTKLDDPENSGTIAGELLRRAEAFGAQEVLSTEPGEWRLISELDALPLKVTQLEDTRFVASHAEFDRWAEGRKELRMEYFYREMRRKTGFLMEGDAPAGGKWNYDHDNRKPAKPDLFSAPTLSFDEDEITGEVLALVEARFSENFGRLRPFRYATDREGAVAALTHFVTHNLAHFGDYQDAMLQDAPHLYHSLLSPYINIGLLSPIEVCEAAARAYEKGAAPLNAVEGFIRQIIGWREFVRGIYFREGPGYTGRNVLAHERNLPALYWGAETRMNCLSQAVGQTRDLAYAHHIQRLMITGNFGLLAGLDPAQLHEWYLSVYIDAFEWVEAPNTIGMSQHADGGIVGSKPYVSSANYIDKMSDYCGACAYSAKIKTGEGACPFNLLYWHFLHHHRARFSKYPRMAQMYRTWDRMAAEKQDTILAEARAFLARMDRGETV